MDTLSLEIKIKKYIIINDPGHWMHNIIIENDPTVYKRNINFVSSTVVNYTFLLNVA